MRVSLLKHQAPAKPVPPCTIRWNTALELLQDRHVCGLHLILCDKSPCPLPNVVPKDLRYKTSAAPCMSMMLCRLECAVAG